MIAGPKIYDELLEELVPAVESLQVGDPAEGDEIEMGPVISKAQQERVLGFLERAREGATVLTGGGANGDRGFFVKPTVVADVGRTHEIVQREVFGPVVTVQRFATTTRRSRGRTTSTTASPPRSGRATSAGR